MSKLTDEQWSTLWTRDTTTTLSSMFPKNYDLNVAEFWQSALAGEPAMVLDLACGNGALVWLANEFLNTEGRKSRITGIDAAVIDPFTTLKKDSQQFPLVEFIGSNPIESLPFDDSSIDVAMSQYGLEYANLPQAIAELGRVLKPKASMAFIMHNEDSTIVKGSTRFLDQHKVILDEIKIHELFFELDALIGKGRDLKKLSAKPKVRKKLLAVDAASVKIKQIMSLVDPEAEIQRYCVPMFNAFSESSVRQGVNRKRIIQRSVINLADYIARIDDLASAALSPEELIDLVVLIEQAGFTVTHNQPIGYKKSANIGTALLAQRGV